jgi:hypothetical protein
MIRIILAISFTLLFSPELKVVAAQPSRSSVSGFELQDFISGIDPDTFTGMAPCVPKPWLAASGAGLTDEKCKLSSV